jgi:hypothetical protein
MGIMILALALAALAVATLILVVRRLRATLAQARRDRDEMAVLATLLQDTNYRLACSRFGQAAVERSIDEESHRGKN